MLIKKQSNCINTNTASFDFSEKNFEQSHYFPFSSQNESKKRLSLVNSGIFSFCYKTKDVDKKSGISRNEKTENRSEFNYTFNNQENKEYKSSNLSSNTLFINKKTTQTKRKNSIFSPVKENKQKNKLNSVGNIRLRFVRKLLKKIKLLKKEKKKYKFLAKTLTQDLHEFIRKQSTKDCNKINDIKADNAENKEVIYDIEDKEKNKISIKNNMINNIKVENNKLQMEIAEFSSEKNESFEEVSSNNISRNFEFNELSIYSPVSLMYESKYENLNVISLGYYVKNKKLRKSVRNLISRFLSTKKQSLNQKKRKNSKKEMKYKKLKTNSSKTGSLGKSSSHVYTDNISDNEKKSSHKKRKTLQISYNFDVGDKKKGKGKKNIFKLENMNESSQKALYSNHNENKENNSLIVNNLKQKIFNNTEYEYGHIFANTLVNGNLMKSYSSNEVNNLMKINSVNFFYIRNTTKYLLKKKVKTKDSNESINKKSINYFYENDEI